MKAAVIYENGAPEVLRYEEVPDPECPDGCVVVDAEAISIEGGDLLALAVSPPPALPWVVGYLSAGTVSEVGAGVEGIAVGDRVVALNAAGSHATRRAVPAAMTWPIPAGGVAGGELQVEIDRFFPLAEAAAAHAYIEGRNAFGRVVLTPGA